MRQILAIESTCDETAAAVIGENLTILSSIVASQDQLHEKFRGVVPEIAARAHLERIFPVIDQAIQQAGLVPAQLAAVAVAITPGLANSLLIGLTAAKSLAWALRIPLITLDHLQAHIYACRLAAGRDIFPCVGMIVSGGHTHLFRFHDAITADWLGGTIDDAAGEAFDKIATLLGLEYPGGPALSRLAESGNPNAIAFPRSFLHDARLDFSFSGLKTAVRYSLFPQGTTHPDPRQISPQRLADVAASFEQAVADVLVSKAVQALRQTGLSRLCVGGGVAANRVFRHDLQVAAANHPFELVIAPPKWCTDNAVMGAIAWEKFQRGQFARLDCEIQPGLVRGRNRVQAGP